MECFRLPLGRSVPDKKLIKALIIRSHALLIFKLFPLYLLWIVTKAIKQLVHPKLLDGSFLALLLPCFLLQWQIHLYGSLSVIFTKVLMELLENSRVLQWCHFFAFWKNKIFNKFLSFYKTLQGLDWVRTWPCKFFMFSTCNTLQTKPFFVLLLNQGGEKSRLYLDHLWGQRIHPKCFFCSCANYSWNDQNFCDISSPELLSKRPASTFLVFYKGY